MYILDGKELLAGSRKGFHVKKKIYLIEDSDTIRVQLHQCLQSGHLPTTVVRKHTLYDLNHLNC